MKAIILPLLLMLATYAPALASSRVKKVEVQKDQIVHVNTAMGIATIIQVPDRPNSVVVGEKVISTFTQITVDLMWNLRPGLKGPLTMWFTSIIPKKKIRNPRFKKVAQAFRGNK
jgi:hypothetical protein